MTQKEYIKTHPEQFKDDIDKWLFTEFGIIGGCCSAEKSHEYVVARMVAERYEQNRLVHCDELTPEQAQVESDFVVSHLKENKRTPTFIDAIEYGMKIEKRKTIDKSIEWIRGFMECSPLFEYQNTESEIRDTIGDYKKNMEE